MFKSSRARSVAALAVLPLAAGVLVACGTDSGSSSAVGECVPEDTELNFGVVSEVRGFDVVNGGSNGAAGGHERLAVFDTLMKYDTEAEEFVPRMAESFEPNEDYTEWTLRLRDGVEFGSGNPVTTEAVEFSVDRHGSDDTVSLYKSQMDLIESVDIVGPLEMTFQLTEPYGDLPAVFAGAPGMLADPEVFEEKGAEEFGLDPGQGGAGAYEVSSYIQGEEVVLTLRDNYWGEADHCVGTLRFVSIDSEEARRDAFLNGELDLVFLDDSATVAEIEQQGYASHVTRNWGDQTVVINHGTGGAERPGEDVRVRQAIAHALDPEVIDARANEGTGVPSSAIVTEESVLWSEGLEGPEFSPDLARELLEEAKADGYNGQITLSCENGARKVDWAIAVEAMLENVGFDVEIDNGRSITDLVVNVFYPGNYDLMCFPISMDDANPWATFQTLLGQDPVAQGRVGYESAAMTEAMAALRAAGTAEERQRAIQQVQEVWNEEVPMAITGHGTRAALWHEYVEGLDFSNGGITVFDNVTMTN